jgi:hypothetical protein
MFWWSKRSLNRCVDRPSEIPPERPRSRSGTMQGTGSEQADNDVLPKPNTVHLGICMLMTYSTLPVGCGEHGRSG